MLVPVKAHRWTGGVDSSVKEIRRFEIAKEATIGCLRGIIAELFDVSEGSFKLYYKDDDEDIVAFSSDNELKTGLTCMKNGLFRVFIEVNIYYYNADGY
ncbi:sequestosome-1-like [Morone saxatilis]|uniref:sequestosome-1-like n=1 Tax=Morone saxatilis TaxID=34816 RepID=UPI0015E1C2D5|nr:sequestosome-1-like [Morone saxatilis]